MKASRLAWLIGLGLISLPAIDSDRAPAPLSERGLANLVAFGRLLGYVRYFHPSDQAATTDWETFAIAGVDRVERARSPDELRQKLEELFQPVAPTLRLSTRPLPALKPAMLLRSGEHPTRAVGWWHHGWSGESSASARWYYGRRISQVIDARSDSILPLGSEVNLDLGGGVWCSMPMTLYADEEATLPHGSSPSLSPRRSEDWIPTGHDRATRLADVTLFWNTAQHFYPYFDVVGTNWPAELPLALREAATDRDGASFELALRRLVAGLRDGHGTVNSPYGDPRPIPLYWRFVEGHLAVLRTDSTIADRVHPGDVVTAIQGRPVVEWVKDAEGIKPAATPQFLSFRVAEALQVMSGRDTVALDLRSPSGLTRRARVPRRLGPLMRPPRPDSIAEVRPGVMYLDLDRISSEEFERALPRILAAKGVVLDLRGYPWRIWTAPITHMIDSTITSPRWNIPIITRPDHLDSVLESSNWTIQPAAPRIRARMAFLIDGSAISAAETFLGIVEYYRLAELVGEPTAGTNGDVATQRLPGGYVVTFTGMQVLKHDGSRHHGVGILPTVPVSPTLAGVQAGRDEQLEKAIEVVSR